MGIRVCQVSFSDIDNDPRVLRTISALNGEGYETIPIGYGHGLNRPAFGLKAKLFTAARQLPARVFPSLSPQIYWSQAENQRVFQMICEAQPQIIHAHDWPVLPAAARAAAKLGAQLIYDSHEFSREQLLHRTLWRQVYPAYIGALENRFAKQADAVITVSDGCGVLIQHACGLQRPPVIIRNTPHFQEFPFRPTKEGKILVQFVGYFTPGRGLRNLIKSVALWPNQYRLRLTGWAEDKNYLAELTALAGEHGGGRIEFHDKVSKDQLLGHVNEADIGVVFADTISKQFEISLPNKLFEYIIAGLMVAVGPGQEMHNLVGKHRLGIVHNNNNPQTLAESFERLSSQQIDEFKKAAIKAAATLNWEHEQVKLLKIYEALGSSLL